MMTENNCVCSRQMYAAEFNVPVWEFRGALCSFTIIALQSAFDHLLEPVPIAAYQDEKHRHTTVSRVVL